MGCADRKLTIRITRKHEHIIELVKYKDDITTTNLCNKIVKDFVQNIINISKNKSDCGYDYDKAFADASTVVLKQFFGVKRAVISFRLTKANEELLYSHLKYYDDDGNIKCLDKKDLSKVVASIVYDFLDRQNLVELCDYVGIQDDEIWNWILNDKKAIKYK